MPLQRSLISPRASSQLIRSKLTATFRPFPLKRVHYALGTVDLLVEVVGLRTQPSAGKRMLGVTTHSDGPSLLDRDHHRAGVGAVVRTRPMTVLTPLSVEVVIQLLPMSRPKSLVQVPPVSERLKETDTSPSDIRFRGLFVAIGCTAARTFPPFHA